MKKENASQQAPSRVHNTPEIRGHHARCIHLLYKQEFDCCIKIRYIMPRRQFLFCSVLFSDWQRDLNPKPQGCNSEHSTSKKCTSLPTFE